MSVGYAQLGDLKQKYKPMCPLFTAQMHYTSAGFVTFGQILEPDSVLIFPNNTQMKKKMLLKWFKR